VAVVAETLKKKPRAPVGVTGPELAALQKAMLQKLQNTQGHYARVSSDNPMLNAFCRVAPSDRFNLLAIFAAGAFLRAIDFSSRTCTDVQARLFFPFFIRISVYEGPMFVAGSVANEKPHAPVKVPGLEIAACSDASCNELVSVGCLALWFGDHFISCTFHSAKLVVITLIGAFFVPRHTLVASRQPLTRILFPDVKCLDFLLGRKTSVFNQIVRSFIVSLRMFNFVHM